MLETNVSIPAFLKAALDAESQRLEPAFRRSSRPLGTVHRRSALALDSEEVCQPGGSASCTASHCEANRHTSWSSGRTRSRGAIALNGSWVNGSVTVWPAAGEVQANA